MRGLLFLFFIYSATAFGFWNDNHVKKAWDEHLSEIETATASHASAQKGYKMAYWAANEAYKLAKNSTSQEKYLPEELASIRSYLQLSASIFKSGTGFGGIKSTPIDPTTRDLAKKTLTILGLMVRDPLFSFEKESTVLAKIQKHRAKEFVEKVQKMLRETQLNLKQKYGGYNWLVIPKKLENERLITVEPDFENEINTFKDDNGESIFSNLTKKSAISLFPATPEEEDQLADTHIRVCPDCKEMQTTSHEMEEWWQARIKEDPRGQRINFTAAFNDSFESYESWSLKYLENGIQKSFSLDSGVGFNIYIPKNVKPGTPVVFIIYDGILANDNLYRNRFTEETLLAHAGCIVVQVHGMGNYNQEEPEDTNRTRYNRKNFPNKIFEDLEDIYVALRDKTFVKNDGSPYPKLITPNQTKVFLHGTSFGGYMTMMAATSDYMMKKAMPGVPFKTLFDGYIPYAGFYDWAKDQTSLENSAANISRGEAARNRNYEERTEDGQRFTITQHTLYLEDDPIQNSALNQKISPLHRLNKLSRPVLLMHGLKDPNVGVDAALNFLWATKKTEKQYLVDHIILPEHQHDFDGNGDDRYSINTIKIGQKTNNSNTIRLFKDYLDPILYFIRQIQNDERPDLNRQTFKKLKKIAQQAKLEMNEEKFARDQLLRYQGPLKVLINDLEKKLESRDEKLIGLLRDPTQEGIIEYAKELAIYKDKETREFVRGGMQYSQATIHNEGSEQRLKDLFLNAIYSIATDPNYSKKIQKIFPPSNAFEVQQSKHLKKLDLLEWLKIMVLKDLIKESSNLNPRERGIKLIKEELSNENVLAYLKALPDFFGISGQYPMTDFFYQLKRKEIRKAIQEAISTWKNKRDEASNVYNQWRNEINMSDWLE